MSNMGRPSGLNSDIPEVRTPKEISPDEITTHIRQMRESNPPGFQMIFLGLALRSRLG